jgi:plasmid stabilization system protein ParE
VTLLISPGATRDLKTAVDYYERERPGLGQRFRDEFDAAVKRIRGFPEGCQQVDDELRRCRFQKFPYALIYAIRGDEIVIVAVSHLRRHPDHWRDRL